mmetsp:Transcript_21008/g.45096  ORF Transcript_21008/g.45096 Transcript_21008/m.45096 type:complete len:238 (-) Transcript_21008:704-1417(-)
MGHVVARGRGRGHHCAMHAEDVLGVARHRPLASGAEALSGRGLPAVDLVAPDSGVEVLRRREGRRRSRGRLLHARPELQMRGRPGREHQRHRAVAVDCCVRQDSRMEAERRPVPPDAVEREHVVDALGAHGARDAQRHERLRRRVFRRVPLLEDGARVRHAVEELARPSAGVGGRHLDERLAARRSNHRVDLACGGAIAARPDHREEVDAVAEEGVEERAERCRPEHCVCVEQRRVA